MRRRRGMVKLYETDWSLITSIGLVCLAVSTSCLVFVVYELGVVKGWWAI